MPSLFEAVGTGGGPRTFDGQPGGMFYGSHPGADGPHGIVVIPVTGYRNNGKPVTITVTYGTGDTAQAMTPLKQVWGNGVSDTTPRSGWVQYFYLLNPPTGPQTWTVTWSSPLGVIEQIQMRANSISYTGVSDVGDLDVVFGRTFDKQMEQTVTAPQGSVLLHAFVQEWFNAITQYSALERMRLSNALTLRPYDTVIGESVGGKDVTFRGRRAIGAAWAGTTLPLIAAQANAIQARPAELLLSGYRPFTGGNVVTALPARLTLAGSTGPARRRTRIQAHPAQLVLSTYQPWLGLPIFPAATVLTLRGLNIFGAATPNDMPWKFRGIFADEPYTMHEVVYPASIAAYSIPRGVDALSAAFKVYPGPYIVLAHSQGAQVVTRWIDEHADDPDAPSADELQFLVTGNPMRATGGAGIGVAEFDGHIGEPTRTDGPWTLIDFARRWDGWPDPNQDHTNTIAEENARRGRSTFHLRYDQPDLYDPTHTIWREGTTIFVLTHEDEPPYYKGSNQPESLITETRKVIESAYTNRPPNDPPIVDVPPANSLERHLIAKMLATP